MERTFFHLTNLEIFQTLRQDLLTKDLPSQLRDLILSIHEVTMPDSPMRHFALELLIYSDIEFSAFKSRDVLNTVNEELASAINRAHDYVLMKLASLTPTAGYEAPTGEPEIKSTLTWRKPKAAFAYLCHAIKVGGCITDNDTMSDLIRTLSKAFNLKVTVHYVNNIISALRSKPADKSVTEFFENLMAAVESDIESRLATSRLA